ncbi:hypothetical protein [Vallitalea okinawensis]|uniref:hypothetical protein n=1 Tax=Vallitalea okinawensis TaxID=2078660 RepID=UPI000CFB9A3E|nr:hypothetical protein [Vallitalea okinawensis]
MKNQQVNILLDALKNKKLFYEKVYDLTLDQNILLNDGKSSKFNIEKFEGYMQSKETYINKINDYDEGFNAFYDNVKEELHLNMQTYSEEIREMQGLIKDLTELSVRIQNLEMKNKQLLDATLIKERKEISNFRKSQNTISAYDKVMKKVIPNQSFFLDRKK